MRKPLNLAYCRRQAAGANCSAVIREHNKHHIQDTPLSPGGDTDAYTSEPEDEQQSECTSDSDSEATQEYIPSDDDSEPTQVHIPSGGLAAPA